MHPFVQRYKFIFIRGDFCIFTHIYSFDCVNLKLQTKWPEQSEELLGLIVNSLRALDGAVPQGCPEPRRRPQSAQKIALVLDKAPKHLQADLVALVPKLVEQSEHPLAAYALLERLQKPDAEPALRIPVRLIYFFP